MPGIGRTLPSTLIAGGKPVVTWRSDAPFSIMYFVQRGHAVADFLKPAHPERLHSQADSGLLDVHDGCALEDQFLDLVLDRHDLIERHASLVPGFVADIASLAVVADDAGGLFLRETRFDEDLGRQLLRFLAVITYPADKPLGDDQDDGS